MKTKTHKQLSKISIEYFNHTSVNEEYFNKLVCKELIDGLTNEELKKLFNIKIINPENKEYDNGNIKWGNVVYQELHMKLQELENTKTLEISAEINEYGLPTLK